MAQLRENPHPGFDGIKAGLCLAEMEAKPNLASGMQPCLRQNGTRSRCTGKERDAESGLDYFGARYYSGAQGRFTSPDPLNWLKWQLNSSRTEPRYEHTRSEDERNGDLGGRQDFQKLLLNPQRLNLYSCVQNNPLSYTDPLGRIGRIDCRSSF